MVVRRAGRNQRKAIRSLLNRARIGRDSALPRELWIATVRRRVVGTAGIELVRPIAVLHSVAVEKQLRRQGIGSRLVARCLAEARARGATAVALVTMFWNVNFFRRAGFATASRKELPRVLRQHPMFSSPKYKYTTPMLLGLDKCHGAAQRSSRAL